jgi:hypothetical protein
MPGALLPIRQRHQIDRRGERDKVQFDPVNAKASNRPNRLGSPLLLDRLWRRAGGRCECKAAPAQSFLNGSEHRLNSRAELGVNGARRAEAGRGKLVDEGRESALEAGKRGYVSGAGRRGGAERLANQQR